MNTMPFPRRSLLRNPQWNFDVFGDRKTASSRLRAWMLADQLQAMGFQATVNGSLAVDVQVFQKVRDPRRLREARSNGARVVFDFDDNYLLEDVGTKNDILAFLNVVDIVTVGSQALLESTRPYHDHVFLLENPLDVLPDSAPKKAYVWEHGLAWFGNPENISVLEELGLRQHVTVITAGGDIPWELQTIDTVLKRFSLVLIPVHLNSWTMAKNANRLLKCVALGVPFLASKTPEHERILRLLNLPHWLLVDARDGWHKKIAHIEDRYMELPEIMASARPLAYEAYGIEAVTQRWIEDVIGCEPSTPSPILINQETGASPREADVVVLSEDSPKLIATTIDSLRVREVEYRSVTIVSALPLPASEDLPDQVTVVDQHADFFGIYASLGRVLGSHKGKRTLVILAGIKLQRGFLCEAMTTTDPEAVHFFYVQKVGEPTTFTNLPPLRLDHLLARPFQPSVLIMPTDAYKGSRGFQPRFGPFATWELLVALCGRNGVPFRCHAEPFVMAEAKLSRRTPMQCYADYLLEKSPGSAEDLPNLENEWGRLASVLQASIIEEHRDLFSQYQSAIIPRLTLELSTLRRQLEMGKQRRSRDLVGYDQLIRQIRQVAEMHLPPRARVIVVSKGDPALLTLGDRQGLHFPQTGGGVYAGHYPADSAAAIAHLETLRARGAEYLLLPSTAFWWLDHYRTFRQHLETHYKRIWNDKDCLIYRLAEPRLAVMRRMLDPVRWMFRLTTVRTAGLDRRSTGNGAELSTRTDER